MTIRESIAGLAIESDQLNLLGKSVDGLGGSVEETIADTVSGNVTIDISKGVVFQYNLTGDTTFSFTGASTEPRGNVFTVIINQDSTGDRQVNWPDNVTWDGNTEPAIAGTANTASVFTFISPNGGIGWIGILSATSVQ